MKTALLLCLGVAWLAGCKTEPPFATHPDVSLLDASNHYVNPFDGQEAKAIVFFFVRTDCPISNRYAPEMQRLAAKHARDGVHFWLVYVEAATSPAEIEQHRKEYHLGLQALRDPAHELVKIAKVTVTPEVAVFLRDGREVYRGRIDDRYVDFGKERPEATSHDLDEALNCIENERPVVSSVTRAVGCYIE